MSFELLVGPPGAGKTTRLLERARTLCGDGRGVLWVGLPAQRAHIYRRATRQGGLAGFEFVSEQQLCYRLMTRAHRLRPLCVGTERLALVAEAVRQVTGRLPGAGEARLYAAGVAEYRRHGLSPDAAHAIAVDPETERLAEVIAAYEANKGDRWDYDDYRLEAVKLAEEEGADPGADAIFVAGFRELLPLSLRLFRALGHEAEVAVALPGLPEGIGDTAENVTWLPPGPEPRRTSLCAGNEVAEARWVLRAIKMELAGGADPGDLALVVPEGWTQAYAALAEEYGVPLMDETPATLVEEPAGRTLVELLRLPEHPSASGLLALPGLDSLAAAALRRGIAGEAALLRLARELDQEAAGDSASPQPVPAVPVATAAATEDTAGGAPAQQAGQEQLLRTWLDHLRPAAANLKWAEDLLERLLTEVLPGRHRLSAEDALSFRDRARQRAREAASLDTGSGFRAWWLALLTETRLPRQALAGVALLTPGLASGRRYRKAWLAGAVEGSYLTPPEEDWFLPEEGRGRELPPRFRGQEDLQLSELAQLADELVVTWAAFMQGGRQAPQRGLVAHDSADLPELPAGTPAELERDSPRPVTYELAPDRVRLPPLRIEELRRYRDCPHRTWAEGLLRESGGTPWPDPEPWRQLRSTLLRRSSLDTGGLEELARQFPWAAAWLRRHANALTTLQYGLLLPRNSEPKVRLDAVGRVDGAPAVYRFHQPAPDMDGDAATAVLRRRWSERWFARWLLGFDGGEQARLFVWPLLGEPVEAGVFPQPARAERWLAADSGSLAEALDMYRSGDVAPRPDRQLCSVCAVFDMCRAGVR